MYSVTECSVCGETARSLVSEFNRLIAIDSMRESLFARSDYVLCHGCGLVYASLRPGAEEYDFLYANFNEFLSRTSKLPQAIFSETGPLTAEMREELDRFYVPGGTCVMLQRTEPMSPSRCSQSLIVNFASWASC
jgi:hypothetical protein